MQKRNIIVIASVLIALAAAYFLGTQNTGLAVLTTEQEKQIEEPKQNSTNSEFKLTSNAIQAIKPELSFEKVKPTELKATILEGKAKNCPQESTLKIQIENIGENKAHRLFTELQNFKVKECTNCEQKEIQPQEIIEVFLSGCKETQNAYAWFYSINAKKETLKIE